MALSTQKIPVTVITRFLGAGKTTLIRNLLETVSGKRIALIINEFGDVGFDGELLKGCGDAACPGENIVELANGCICCTVADDFLPAITGLLEHAAPPDHIVIETSGLALPQPLVRAFNWPEIRNRVTVDGVVTVVDSAAVAEGRFAHDEDAVQAQREQDSALDHDSPLHELFEDQLACADMVLLNKADLVAPAKLDEIELDLKREARPGVAFLRAAQGAVPAHVLFGIEAQAQDDLEARKSHHEMQGEADHDHDDFESFVTMPKTVHDKEKFLAKLKTTIADHGVLRVKGFIAVEGAQARLVVQAVGPRVESYFENAISTNPAALVIIGEKGLDETAIRRALED